MRNYKIIILIALLALILFSCEKEYSIAGNHNTDPNYPANSIAIEKIIEISDYIITSETIYMYDFAFDSNNTLWVATNFGLLKIMENSHELFRIPNSTDNYYLNTITIDNNDNIWLTSTNNVYRFTSINNDWDTYSYNNGDFLHSSYSRVYCDAEGEIYIIDGLCVYKFHNNNWEEFIRFENIINDIAPYAVMPLNQDIIARVDDILWISTHTGLIKYKNDTSYEFISQFDPGPLYHQTTYSIHTDNKNRLWINNEGTVQVVENNIWTQYENKKSLKVCGDYIIAHEYMNGDILFCKDESWHALLNEYFFKLRGYRQIRTDADNSLWISDAYKIYKIKPEVLQ